MEISKCFKEGCQWCLLTRTSVLCRRKAPCLGEHPPPCLPDALPKLLYPPWASRVAKKPNPLFIRTLWETSKNTIWKIKIIIMSLPNLLSLNHAFGVQKLPSEWHFYFASIFKMYHQTQDPDTVWQDSYNFPWLTYNFSVNPVLN